MLKSQAKQHLGIWVLAFGYFAFYVPYSGLTKAYSLGLLPGMAGPVPGFVLLPATVLATSVGLLAFITFGGGWQVLERRRMFGLPLPTVRMGTFFSGLATAAIIATTTLNYTFTGISILLALLLMRGGVLTLAPIVDAIGRRRVNVSSWVALAFCLVAICLAFSEVDGYQMTLLAGSNIAAYLAGYVVRLNLMTSMAKSRESIVNRRYFVEETGVAAVALTAVPALVAVVGRGEIPGQLRDGFTSFIHSDLVWPAFLIGLLYACLYMFGTGIYIDARENTFCISLNRCSSLVSGLVASFALTVLLGCTPPTGPQLVGAVIILSALVLLMVSTYKAYRFAARAMMQRVFLFVCGGNTSRSPMAQAICNDEFARRLGLSLDGAGDRGLRAVSAGLTARPGSPLSAPAAAALRRLGVAPHAHSSLEVTADLVHQAAVVFCMTEAQRRELIGRFPGASGKLHLLDPEGDIDDPSGQDENAFMALGALLQRLVRNRIAEFTA